jgi:S-adenosylmethionine:tRNA ribosyltransferase-isomerase
MIKIREIKISDYDYQLPPEKIAQFPLEKRDASKLLVWKEGEIEEDVFSGIEKHLPGNSLMVFNDTRVIRARLIFAKSTGATIEVFCLEPVLPTAEIHGAFLQTGSCTWSCLVGNVKRWKNGVLRKDLVSGDRQYSLFAEKMEEAGDGRFLVRFSWEPSLLTFSEALEVSGRIPLPPYITRGDTETDALRYQTIYAKEEGSVAAPTAGLHFTPEVMERLRGKGISFARLALHIGVGTFRPVSSPTIEGHVMHSEKIVVPRSVIQTLLEHNGRPVTAVGTTSLRTLESLYWTGVRMLHSAPPVAPVVDQWDPYDEQFPADLPAKTALEAVDQYLVRQGLQEYSGSTQLMIVPGYKFRIVDAMVTNFHMPKSTLLLLVAAFIGEEWKKAYSYALVHDFRMLSYGDSCLFFRSSGINSVK